MDQTRLGPWGSFTSSYGGLKYELLVFSQPHPMVDEVGSSGLALAGHDDWIAWLPSKCGKAVLFLE